MRHQDEMEDVLLMSRDAAGLRVLAGWLDARIEALNLSRKAQFALRLCVEEAVMNIVNHAICDDDGAAISIGARIKDGALEAWVEDSGLPFDPLTAPPMPRPLRLEEATGGGSGIRLMRHYASRMAYARIGGRNRLSFTLDL